MNLALRSWQARFLQELRSHDGDDFLLVACPAAGKTIAAGVGAAAIMEERECDQLIVVCPTVVVRDQWEYELGQLGFAMLTTFGSGGWPDHVHGICTTYAQVALRYGQLAEACSERGTVVILDEIHHAGERLSWGTSINVALRSARFRLALSGTPFRSDQDRIPFVRYDPRGRCRPNFSYDYPRAVRDGVCRPIEFRVHDGVITWREELGPRTAAFSDKLHDRTQQARRLRASLDATKRYLRSLLERAHADLMGLRHQAPDAAGLVICDTQAHALDVDRLLNEITGQVPTLAISDIPHGHQAIRAFAKDAEEEWIVSVRMVSEGVDIPRLGVIVWATASRTELMVRQVAGRALRGREGFAQVPAIVHMPADPGLVRYAHSLDVLGGIPPRMRIRQGSEDAVAIWSATADRSRPAGHGGCNAIEAEPHRGEPMAIAPPLPPSAGRLRGAPEPTEVRTPELPPSPAELQAAEEARRQDRGDLFRLLGTYAQLQRHVNPAYQLASAHSELVACMGPVGPDAPDELVADALSWIRDRTSELAAGNPEEMVALARSRRRLALAASRA